MKYEQPSAFILCRAFPECISMQETQLEKVESPSGYPSWWKRILTGALAGAVFGALNIWFYEFSLRRLLAAILSGACFVAVFGLLAVKFRTSKLKVTVIAGLAGSLAGAVYWVVGRPASLLLAIGIGLVIGIVYGWAELKD